MAVSEALRKAILDVIKKEIDVNNYGMFSTYRLAQRAPMILHDSKIRIDRDKGIVYENDKPLYSIERRYSNVRRNLMYKELTPTLTKIDAPRKRLFVDMDGTLSTFIPVAQSALYEKGYFLNLPPHQNVIDTIKGLNNYNQDIDIYVLSAYLTQSEFALQEKNEWLDRYMPNIRKEQRIFVPCGENKANFIDGGITANDYILDDYTHNLDKWNEAGGVAIKLLNDINASNGTWEGNRIRYDSTPPQMADTLQRIILQGQSVREEIPPKNLDKTEMQKRVKSAENIREKALQQGMAIDINADGTLSAYIPEERSIEKGELISLTRPTEQTAEIRIDPQCLEWNERETLPRTAKDLVKIGDIYSEASPLPEREERNANMDTKQVTRESLDSLPIREMALLLRANASPFEVETKMIDNMTSPFDEAEKIEAMGRLTQALDDVTRVRESREKEIHSVLAVMKPKPEVTQIEIDLSTPVPSNYELMTVRMRDGENRLLTVRTGDARLEERVDAASNGGTTASNGDIIITDARARFADHGADNDAPYIAYRVTQYGYEPIRNFNASFQQNKSTTAIKIENQLTMTEELACFQKIHAAEKELGIVLLPQELQNRETDLTENIANILAKTETEIARRSSVYFFAREVGTDGVSQTVDRYEKLEEMSKTAPDQQQREIAENLLIQINENDESRETLQDSAYELAARADSFMHEYDQYGYDDARGTKTRSDLLEDSAFELMAGNIASLNYVREAFAENEVEDPSLIRQYNSLPRQIDNYQRAYSLWEKRKATLGNRITEVLSGNKERIIAVGVEIERERAEKVEAAFEGLGFTQTTVPYRGEVAFKNKKPLHAPFQHIEHFPTVKDAENWLFRILHPETNYPNFTRPESSNTKNIIRLALYPERVKINDEESLIKSIDAARKEAQDKNELKVINAMREVGYEIDLPKSYGYHPEAKTVPAALDALNQIVFKGEESETPIIFRTIKDAEAWLNNEYIQKDPQGKETYAITRELYPERLTYEYNARPTNPMPCSLYHERALERAIKSLEAYEWTSPKTKLAKEILLDQLMDARYAKNILPEHARYMRVIEEHKISEEQYVMRDAEALIKEPDIFFADNIAKDIIEAYKEKIDNAMLASGYEYDKNDSYETNFVYLGEVPTFPMTFESLIEAKEWLTGVVLDDPEVEEKIDKALYPQNYLPYQSYERPQYPEKIYEIPQMTYISASEAYVDWKEDKKENYGYDNYYLRGFNVEFKHVITGEYVYDSADFMRGNLEDNLKGKIADWREVGYVPFELERTRGYEPTGRAIFRGYVEEKYDQIERDSFFVDADDQIKEFVLEKGGLKENVNDHMPIKTNLKLAEKEHQTVYSLTDSDYGTLDELVTAAKNYYITDENALHKLAELLKDNDRPEDSLLVKIYEEIAREQASDGIKLGVAKLDAHNGLYQILEDEPLREDGTLRLSMYNEGEKLIIQLTETTNGEQSVGTGSILRTDFYDMTPPLFDEAVGAVYAYSMVKTEPDLPPENFIIKGYEVKDMVYMANIEYNGEDMQRAVMSQSGTYYISTGNRMDNTLERHDLTPEQQQTFIEFFNQNHTNERSEDMENKEQPDMSKKDKLKEQLENGIKQALDSDQFKNWLATGGKLFYNNYSFTNAMLVWMQKPDASHVMGYDQWKDFGRNVKQGAQGAQIIIPVMAKENRKDGLFSAIKSDLLTQLRDRSEPVVTHQLGGSKIEFTMNRSNHLMGIRVDGKERGIFNNDDEMKKYIDRAILGKVPIAFTAGTVFDVKDCIVPEYLWVKRGFTKEEVVNDKNGKPIKNNRGETKIVNTLERQAKLATELDTKVASQDPVKMARLYEALQGVCSNRGVPVVEEEIKSGAQGTYNRLTNTITILNSLPLTEKCSTLLHEMAHADLHKDQNALAQEMGLSVDDINKSLKETQAEAVAYSTASTFGIETSTSSFNYMAAYTSGFSLQDFQKSLEVIYKETRALTADIKAELDTRGFNLDLTIKDETKLNKDTIKNMTDKYLTVTETQIDGIERAKRELPILAQAHGANKDIMEVLKEQTAILETRTEDVSIMHDNVELLNTAETRKEQDKAITLLESAVERLDRNSATFNMLSERFVDLSEQQQGGLKAKYDKAPLKVLESMKETHPELAKLTSSQIDYIAKSKVISRDIKGELKNAPDSFVANVANRATAIVDNAAKNGAVVEVSFCENWTSKPVFENGTICHPKIADRIIESAEKQIQGIRGEANKNGVSYPYTKCDISLYAPTPDGKMSVIHTRIDIGDGAQKGLKDHIDSIATRSKEKGEVKNSLAEAFEEKGQYKNKIYVPQENTQKETDKNNLTTALDVNTTHKTKEQWKEEIDAAKDKAAQQKTETAPERSDKEKNTEKGR